jgi:hypothetical protein
VSLPALPEFIQDLISEHLLRLGSKLSDSKKLARAIETHSNFYIENPKATTPWSEPWAQMAQVCYYLPLNFMRNQRVLEEGQRLEFFHGLTHWVEFGAGYGTSTWAALSCLDNWSNQFEHIVWVEHSCDNSIWSSKLEVNCAGDFKMAKTLDSKAINVKKSIGVFSYSLTELSELPSWAYECEALAIIEPSTHEDGRKLQSLRQQLIDCGFSVWAPCVHEKHCPLLLHSHRDWCHHRFLWQRPDWLKEIELHLPWKNQSLTYSYLLARKTPPPWKNEYHLTQRQLSDSSAKENVVGRVIGDTMLEKGKTRQMVCANNERLFLAWLHKNGEAPWIPNGTLVSWPANSERKSNEVRPVSTLEIRKRP